MHNSDPTSIAQPSAHQAWLRFLNYGILALIGLEVGLAIAYLSSSLIHGASPDFLDFNGLRTLPSLIQAVQLFLIGAIALGLLICSRQLNHRLSPVVLICIALLCGFGGFDELFKIHLTFKQFNWKGIYLGLLTAIPVLCWKDLIRLWRSHRDTLMWVGAGMGVFLLGGFGAEFLKDGFATLFNGQDAETVAFALERSRVTIEELAELIGETIIIYGMGRFVIQLLD